MTRKTPSFPTAEPPAKGGYRPVRPACGRRADARAARLVADEDGGIIVFWAIALVAIMGISALVFEMGRLATTQSELQSFADSVSLAAAAELDGASDAIDRATTAATTLITDTQTFADGGATLDASDIATLTFYRPGPDGAFARDAALVTTDPRRARYVAVDIADRQVSLGIGAAFAALGGGTDTVDTDIAARSAAGFSLEACNVAPVAVCLPTVDFDAEASIGETLELSASVGIDNLVPGQIAAVDSLTGALDGLEVCAGLSGGDLTACLIAAREPETACTGRGGLVLSADVDGSGVLESLDTQFDRFAGVAAGLAGNPDFSGGPNVLTGLTTALGLCLPIDIPLVGGDQISLPVDDCMVSGACGLQGDGNWSLGRTAYVEQHYGGDDPFPGTSTRLEFYLAEVAAAAEIETPTGTGLGGLIGGVTDGFVPQLCAPQQNQDPLRRVMVVAGIDCTASVDATVSAPPVQQFFEVFTLGPAENGTLSVEISACLGGNCDGGTLDTDVRDIVRLVE